MSSEEKLLKDIESLRNKIKSGKYQGEQYQLAVDMLKTKQDELNSLRHKKSVKPILDAPIVGLREKKQKTLSEMRGGMKT